MNLTGMKSSSDGLEGACHKTEKQKLPHHRALREKGAEVLELPSIRTQALEDQTALYQALNHISDYQWAVFTSPTGAEIFWMS